MARKSDAIFTEKIYVCPAPDGDYLLIIGDGGSLDDLDVDEGGRVATYKLQSVKTYRKSPRLE